MYEVNNIRTTEYLRVPAPGPPLGERGQNGSNIFIKAQKPDLCYGKEFYKQ